MNLVTGSSTETKLRSTKRITLERVAVTFVTEAMSKMVVLETKGVEKGRSLWEQKPKGKLQRVSVRLATLRTPPEKAPELLYFSTTLQTLDQSYCWQRETISRKVPNIHFMITLIINLISVSKFEMKAISNAQSELSPEPSQNGSLKTRLHELQTLNKESEGTICQLEHQIFHIEKDNADLQEQLEKQEKQWKDMCLEEEGEGGEVEEEQQQEMQDWIEQVQKYNGLPQETIDSLLTIEFEGDQEICPACYGELTVGSLCTYLPCSHLFHKDCIGNHLKVNRFCLACQEPVGM